MTTTSGLTTVPPPSGTASAEPVDHPRDTHPSTPSGPPQRGRFSRLIRGGTDDPRWARPLLIALLVITAAAYLWDLSINGNANEFYAAAVKSGTESWKAWLFGSLDSSNAITVDKPPASLWIMGLSGRIFGFSSFSMLLPEALMGVGTVALLYAAVRRTSGHAAGLVAGALVALTPVAALMFRFNNPDAMLVLLMTLGAYFVVRAIEKVPADRKSHALRWLLLAGTAIGFAFLTKMLQGLLVLPAFGVVYLPASDNKLWTRIWHLLAALGAVVVSAGWFVALVALWPADSRPYIGGSTTNSLWELAIGYNGLGRIFGGSGNGGGGGGGGGISFGGTTGLTRMFGTAFGSQISWLIPAALVAFIAGMWFTRKAPRTDRTRAGILLWGGWTIVTALVLSYMQGTVHPYYSVALVPGIAGVVAIAGKELWRGRESHLARATLALMITVTAGWSYYLMDRDAPTFLPWLRWTVLIAGVLGAAVLAASVGRLKKYAVIGLLVGSVAAMAGSAAFTVDTIGTAHTGATPTAGPATARGGFPGGGALPSGLTSGDFSGTMPGGTMPSGTLPSGTSGTMPSGALPSGMGGGGSTTTNTALVALLNKTTNRWAAATVSAQSAETYILSSDKAVMAIGGFSGTDNSPTLAQFQAYVAAGDIHYFISGGFGGGGGGFAGGQSGSTTSASQITAWVKAHYTATTVGGVTVYDLTTATTS
ncbi:4-amino-4-deoxy-L-arabinose transferase [Nakamurella panacisegetis]|uniref:4-amino-4-deoxy-L-arabinose transferase n=1 Tax=Nakamurella panacisegetis TaxID=1090615 RepID=A0A1H0J115_9ACTN|nr:glycosyltransferase family 39 protein [Nakamurella panacisegetis]SDO37424.1 4-amino-4-deoxy-L-arabinose transferase [Nakamurella panacisegetis]